MITHWESLILHRVVKHEEADRPHINRNTRGQSLAEVVRDALTPGDIYAALTALGTGPGEDAPFKSCHDEDDLANALTIADEATATLALAARPGNESWAA